MNETHTNQPFPILGASLALIGTSVVGMLIGLGVLAMVGRLEMVEPLALSLGACLFGSLIGQWPVWQFSASQIDGVAVGFMLAVLMRIVVTLVVMGILVGMTGYSAKVFVGWIAPSYVLLLGTEVWLIKRYLERRGSWVATTPATEQAL